MRVFALALASIALSVAAQFLLKDGMGRIASRMLPDQVSTLRTFATAAAEPSVIAGFALYGMGALVWLLVLRDWDVSKAYPLVGLGFAATLLLGWSMGENVTPARGAGVALICIGVALVGRS